MRKMPTTKQIDELQKMIDEGGSGGNSKIFTAIYGTTTYAELDAAYKSGKYDLFIAVKYSDSFIYDRYYILQECAEYSSDDPTIYSYEFYSSNGINIFKMFWNPSATTGELANTTAFKQQHKTKVQFTSTDSQYTMTAWVPVNISSNIIYTEVDIFLVKASLNLTKSWSPGTGYIYYKATIEDINITGQSTISIAGIYADQLDVFKLNTGNSTIDNISWEVDSVLVDTLQDSIIM